MPAIYIVLGIVLLFFRDAYFEIYGIYRTVFGVALIGYGALRLYQTYLKDRTHEE
jgi:hypothetical protein